MEPRSTKYSQLSEDEDDGGTLKVSNRNEESGEIGPVTYTCDEAIEKIGFGKFQIKLLFVTGFVWSADAIEIISLSFLAPSVSCYWNLQPYEEALLTTAVFTGMLLGAFCFGMLSDKFGRRYAYLATTSFTFVFGILSAMAPSYYWLLIARAFVGFGVAGSHVAFTLFTEFLPSSKRATYLVLVELFWTFGTVGTSFLAWLVMPTLGWRWMLVFAAVPFCMLMAVFPYLPESVRFLLITGREKEANNVLRSLALTNNQVPLQGKVVLAVDPSLERPTAELTPLKEHNDKRGHLKDLLAPPLRRTTLTLWFLWFNNSFVYYGMVLMVTQLLSYCHDGGSNDKSFVKITKSTTTCLTLSNKDYIDILITTFAELPGILITLYLIDKLGRKKTQCVTFLVTAASCFLLSFCTNRSLETVVMFVGRGAITGAFQAVYVYNSEVYPTSLRSTALGLANSISRIGGQLTPYVAQVMADSISPLWSMTVYGIFSIFAACAAWMLPIETKGRIMQDVIG